MFVCSFVPFVLIVDTYVLIVDIVLFFHRHLALAVVTDQGMRERHGSGLVDYILTSVNQLAMLFTVCFVFCVCSFFGNLIFFFFFFFFL